MGENWTWGSWRGKIQVTHTALERSGKFQGNFACVKGAFISDGNYAAHIISQMSKMYQGAVLSRYHVLS